MQIRYRDQLGELLKELGLPLIVAEVGVAEGMFSKQIMDWGTQELYLIDRWEQVEDQKGDASYIHEWHENNLMQVMSRMAIYDNRPQKYVILQGESTEMVKYIPDNYLSMVFLDADHSYEGVKADLEAWFPKLVTGGVMSGHDYLNEGYGVKRAVEEFTKDRFEVVTIPETDPNNASFYFIKTNS